MKKGRFLDEGMSNLEWASEQSLTDLGRSQDLGVFTVFQSTSSEGGKTGRENDEFPSQRLLYYHRVSCQLIAIKGARLTISLNPA